MKTLILIALLTTSTAQADDATLQSLHFMVMQLKSCLYDRAEGHSDSRECKLLAATEGDRSKLIKQLDPNDLTQYEITLLKEISALYDKLPEAI